MENRFKGKKNLLNNRKKTDNNEKIEMGIVTEKNEKLENPLLVKKEKDELRQQDITYHFRHIEHEGDFDYEKSEITNIDDVNRLKALGKVVYGSSTDIRKNQVFLGLALFEAKEKIPHGSFMDWCVSNGLTSSQVSRFQKRVEANEKHKIPFDKLAKCSERVVAMLTKKTPDYTEEEMNEIVNSDDPGKELSKREKERKENIEKPVLPDSEIEEVVEIWVKFVDKNGKEVSKEIRTLNITDFKNTNKWIKKSTK